MTNQDELTKPTKPSDRLTITVNGAEQEIFMSGGLIRQIVQTMGGSVEQMSLIMTNPYYQNELMVEALKPRNKRGAELKVIKEPYTIDDFSIGQEESETLINWIIEHVLYFFMSSLTSAQALSVRIDPILEKLSKLVEQSQTGSQDSPESKPSVGPSEPSPVTSN